jgi:hypothetical protein
MKRLFLLCILLPHFATDLYAGDVTVPEPSSSTPHDLKNCAFVTNNCELCMVKADGTVVGSSVGIACVPTVKRCLVKK